MALEMMIALALLVLVVLLLCALLLRRSRVALPPEWPQRLQALESAVQATQLAVAKNDGALDAMGQQLRGFTHSTQVLLDERLQLAAQESRTSRAELQAAFGALQQRLEQQLVQGRSDEAQARGEQLQALAVFRTELTQTAQALKGDVQAQLEAHTQQLRHQFAALQEAVGQQLTGLAASSQQGAEALRAALNERLAAIQQDNAAKLEEMRRTVDEKLHATLEQRLGDSFKLVSERLELVHKGLGEMQTLAAGVGDLKRVMTNVKTRGTWGELQLGAIIDNVLTPAQYEKNVKTQPGSDELVEFAIRLPGRSEEQPVWLPIDSKYPVEHYQRLVDAQDQADKGAIAAAGNAFEASIKLEAKKIFSKYVAPPYTTDFAVLYLPTEGLFAEVMRRPGLVEAVQNDCRVMITGPANLAAMLSSLQMGFKTLAIEKRSSEVWGVLGQVKTEFAKFGEVVEATRKSIDAAARRFDQVGVRTRAIQRHLRNVQELPATAGPEQPLFPATPPGSDQISAEDEE